MELISVNTVEWRRRFGGMETLLEQTSIRLLNLRTSVIGVRPDLTMKDFLPRPNTTLEEAQKGTRQVYSEDGFINCPIYERSRIPWESRFLGPRSLSNRTQPSGWNLG